MAPAEAKSQRLNCRLTPADRDLFAEAAALKHESLSDFVIESARERAETLLADRRVFVLDADRWDAFSASLDEPAQANPAVVELLRRTKP